MKVLVIGGGGREHALAWKLAQSTRVSEVLVAPGNAGTDAEPKCRNVAIAATDIDGLLKLARDEAVAVTVVEHLYGAWEITKKSQDFVKKDANTVEFTVNVPANGQSTVTYTVRNRF
jgi:hypothetical protein